MASTYEPIATTTISGSTTATVTFSSFSGYTDIHAVLSIKHTTSSRYSLLRLNGDTGSNYSLTFMYGNGTTAGSARDTNQTSIGLNASGYESSTEFTNFNLDLMNYSNATTYKTILNRGNAATIQVAATVYSWRSTSAISSMSFTTGGAGSGYFAAGSTFTLYGIAAA